MSSCFGDPLRRRASAATYLYQNGSRAWCATQPRATKLAEDRAEQLERDPDKVAAELEVRLRTDLKRNGGFSRIHPLPRSGADVPDDYDARLVVHPAEHAHTKESGNAAETAARAILESRGHAPRHYRNTLVFLAADGAVTARLPETWQWRWFRSNRRRSPGDLAGVPAHRQRRLDGPGEQETS